LAPPFEEDILDAYIENMSEQFESWSTRLEKLVAGMDRAGEEYYRRRLDDLRAKHTAARARLEDLKAAEGEDQERCRAEILVAWNDFENALADFQQSELDKATEQIPPLPMPRNRVRPLHPRKRMITSADAMPPHLGGQSAESGTEAALTHDKITESAYRLWQGRGRPREQEE
jgi:hypothetical protein